MMRINKDIVINEEIESNYN